MSDTEWLVLQEARFRQSGAPPNAHEWLILAHLAEHDGHPLIAHAMLMQSLALEQGESK